MSCYKTSNNRFFGDNPIMSDGRFFTDYRPSQDQKLNAKHRPEGMPINPPNINSLAENCDCKVDQGNGKQIPVQYYLNCGSEGCDLNKNFKTGYENVLGLGRQIKTNQKIMGNAVSPLLSQTETYGALREDISRSNYLNANNVNGKDKCKPNICHNYNKEYCIIDPDMDEYITKLQNSSDPNSRRKLMAYKAYRSSPSVCDKTSNNI